MAGIKGLYKIQFGKETTLGTQAAATTYWRGQGVINEETVPVFPAEDVGIIGGIGRNYIPNEGALIDLPEIEATFEQLPYLFNMGVVGVAGSRDGTAGSGYSYTYALPISSVVAPYTYTYEMGDNQQAEVVTACFAEEISISGKAGEAWMMSATLRGWAGGPATFTTSVSVPTVEEVLFGNTSLYIDDIGGTMGGTQKTATLREFKLTLSKLFKGRYTGDGAGLHYTYISMTSKPDITLEFTLEHDTAAVAERAARRALSPRKVRLQATGAALTTTGTYTTKLCRFDLVGTYAEVESLADDDGNMQYPFKLMNHYSPAATTRGSIVVVNQLSALP